ncbi:SRPBCC family protein [Occultella aeris]|uniref:Polyketide cyclase / dehydrase and lipid transport n=1 Tax=Occultella aeris TaxID=2761496 RepID=A0A7M4DM40_9MICO|nr:SRPBCC family protein [Occultella aeris]VZO38372.1 Polyketide cyclase / dehydrase and lipid transport [Occultella aeris]
MADGTFTFTSTWRAEATPAQVWRVLSDVARWPQWWPGVVAATVVRPGDGDHLGQRTVLTVRAPTGYLLRFGVELTDVSPGSFAHARVVGDLAGAGAWSLSADGEAVVMVIVWQVRARRRWMRLVSPLAGRSFARAHAAVMAAGQRGLRAALAGVHSDGP